MTEATGKHVVIDFYSCYEEPISSKESLTEIFSNLLTAIHYDSSSIEYHEFTDEHVLISVSNSSHMAIHAYPKYGYVALDIYTFQTTFSTALLIKFLKEAIGAEQVKMTSVNRGDYRKIADMKPRSKTKTTAKARVKRTGKQIKKTSSKMLKIITRKKSPKE